MDGENNGKPYEQMDDLGGKPPIFGNTQMAFLWVTGVKWSYTDRDNKNSIYNWLGPTSEVCFPISLRLWDSLSLQLWRQNEVKIWSMGVSSFSANLIQNETVIKLIYDIYIYILIL